MDRAKPASAIELGERRRTAWVCALLSVMVLAIYAPVYYHDFLNYDDGDYVTENPNVIAGLTWKGLTWAFVNLHGEHTYWHPLTWVSHMLDCQLFGLHPGPHHLVNVLFHSANSVLLFLVLKRMTGAFGRSALVAALFALHPLQVDTVAWVTERKNVLSTLFWLLTRWAYIRYAKGRRQKAEVRMQKPEVGGPWSVVRGPWSLSPLPSTLFYLLALFFFACGLMCKPALVTLPFVLLLLDYWPLRRLSFPPLHHSTTPSLHHSNTPSLHHSNTPSLHHSNTPSLHLIWEKLPFLALAATASFITVAAHRELHSLSGSAAGLDWRLANAVVSYVRYLGKAFWPAHLAVFYPFPGAWPEETVAASGLLLLALSGLVIWRARVAPYWVTGWFWFLGVLVPMIGIIQAGEQAMADRFAYVPLIGLFIMVAWGAADLAGRRPWAVAGLKWAGALALSACAFLTSRQLPHWQNTVTLFEHALAVTPDNTTAHMVLGIGLHSQGWNERAMAEYRTAAALNPSGNTVHYNMGLLLHSQRKWQDAADQYELFIRLNSESPPDSSKLLYCAHFNLVDVLSHLGRFREAVAHLREAVRLYPDDVAALNNLAWVLASSNDPEIRNGAEAVRLAEHACKLTRHQATLLVGTLAAAYAEAGRFADAVATAQKACALASKAKDQALLKKNQELLELYRAGKPHHEPPSPPPTGAKPPAPPPH
jgi:tetratricopeptide (TPR) repeat protein